MRRCYAEFGYGNKTLFSTEIEEGKKETRINKFILPREIDDMYVRVCLGKSVYIFSTKDGAVKKEKNKRSFKLLIGVAGECKYKL